MSFTTTRLSDIKIEPGVLQDIESSYRRGVTHGVVMCIRAVDRGKTKRSLYKWLDRLMRWRFKRHNGKMECPEEI